MRHRSGFGLLWLTALGTLSSCGSPDGDAGGGRGSDDTGGPGSGGASSGTGLVGGSGATGNPAGTGGGSFSVGGANVGGGGAGSGGLGSGGLGSGGLGSGGLGSGGGGGASDPIDCEDDFELSYAASGLPLLETNPGAPVVLFIDFDGGTYLSSSGDTEYPPYNRSGSSATFDEQEQQDIVLSITHLDRYFAMFDVNVSTDDAARQAASGGWGWIVVTEDYSGGRASTGLTSIGKTYQGGRAVCGAETVRNSDRSRRIAHELGHNFTLKHSGPWEGSTFYKWEDYSGWDGVYGPIMGGGGEGERNGWSNGPAETTSKTQDDSAVIRSRLVTLGSTTMGYRKDDFATTSPMCEGTAGALYRKGILGSPDDSDEFEFAWPGGEMTVEAIIPEVSAALIVVEIWQGDSLVHSVKSLNEAPASAAKDLPAGSYTALVKPKKVTPGETGEYPDALGAYEFQIRPE